MKESYLWDESHPYRLFYEGSVKNVYVGENDSLFEFTDKYSLFDWGEMPDHLLGKGESLAMMGALFFEQLSKKGITHHFLGLCKNNQGELTSQKTNCMKVKSVPVLRPKYSNNYYDYSAFKRRPQTCLVPLEVIFRFGVGRGSSLLKRVEQRPELLNQWGMKNLKTDYLFDGPIIDFSTKLEQGDRYLSHSEAQGLSGMSHAEFKDLIAQSMEVAKILKAIFMDLGLELWDGKMEWAFCPGEIRKFMLVDSIGLDELRVEKNNLPLSKEFLREYYRETTWFKKLLDAKNKGQNFKQLNLENPPNLDQLTRKRAELLYQGFVNDLSFKLRGIHLFEKEITLKDWRAIS